MWPKEQPAAQRAFPDVVGGTDSPGSWHRELPGGQVNAGMQEEDRTARDWECSWWRGCLGQREDEPVLKPDSSDSHMVPPHSHSYCTANFKMVKMVNSVFCVFFQNFISKAESKY